MPILLGILAYLIISFPLAVLWHMKIFRKKYLDWKYFGDDVQPAFGLASMIVQGAVLSYGYSMLSIHHLSLLTGIEYSMFMGLFLWSAHVLAAMGKSSHIRHVEFFLMETIYVAIQFGLYGILIHYIF